MLRLFRAFATSTFGPIILGLVTFAFLILGPSTGIREVLNGHLQNAVVQAGARVVSQQEFQRLFEKLKRDWEIQNQAAFPLEDVISKGIDRQLVDDLASQNAHAEMLSRAGVRPSDTVVAQELRRSAESGQDPQMAEMFDSVSGKFRPQLLQNFLRQNGISFDTFQRERRDHIASAQFQAALGGGFQTPKIYAAVAMAAEMQNRDVSFFAVQPDPASRPAPPTDADLKALVPQVSPFPETRRITFVQFSAKALAPTMPVDPAAVEQQYRARAATYNRPEERSFVEIPLKDPKLADQVRARLGKGEDPAAVARSIGVAAIAYADQPKTAIPDVKAAEAAFSMAVGEIRGPVPGDFNPVILKVTKITAGQAASLDQVRPQIEAELRQQSAIDKVYEETTKFEDARDAGASVADAAAKVGATAVSLGPINNQGQGLTAAQPDPRLTQKVLQTAFRLAQGADSELEREADKGEYYAVHVDQVVAQHPLNPATPEERQLLTQIYLQRALTKAVQARADAALAAIRGGASLESAAKGARIYHQVGMQPLGAQQYAQSLGPTFVARVFQAKAGELFSAPAGPVMLVVRVDAIRPADAKAMADHFAAARAEINQSYLEGLAGTTVSASARLIKPRTNLALADAAMGADPAMLARARPKLVSGKPGLAK
ncbi:MAG: peptidylprolyl isomerase [Caulobacteraceae bacterium]|nr:peptidylprolyl isomerase [Caulobacteraceae bacterium]